MAAVLEALPRLQRLTIATDDGGCAVVVIDGLCHPCLVGLALAPPLAVPGGCPPGVAARSVAPAAVVEAGAAVGVALPAGLAVTGLARTFVGRTAHPAVGHPTLATARGSCFLRGTRGGGGDGAQASGPRLCFTESATI